MLTDGSLKYVVDIKASAELQGHSYQNASAHVTLWQNFSQILNVEENTEDCIYNSYDLMRMWA